MNTLRCPRPAPLPISISFKMGAGRRRTSYLPWTRNKGNKVFFAKMRCLYVCGLHLLVWSSYTVAARVQAPANSRSLIGPGGLLRMTAEMLRTANNPDQTQTQTPPRAAIMAKRADRSAAKPGVVDFKAKLGCPRIQ
jgi:hypothetical protein